MTTVYKYRLANSEYRQEIEMPGSPVLFKVGLDPQGDLCVWALVDPAHEKKPKTFFVHGTGHAVDSAAYMWIGTVQQGPFMWHVFIP